jgi:hypothetical protein
MIIDFEFNNETTRITLDDMHPVVTFTYDLIMQATIIF